MPEPAVRFRFRGQRASVAALGVMTLGFLALSAVIVAAAWTTAEYLAAIVALPLLAAAGLTGTMAWKLPRAAVVPSARGLSIYVPLAMTSVVPWDAIESAMLVNHPWWQGVGIRLIGNGGVALATAPGPAAELVLRHAQRVTIIPPVVRVHVRRLRLTVDDPAGLVEAVRARPVP